MGTQKSVDVRLQSFKPVEIQALLENTEKYFRQRNRSQATIDRYHHDMEVGHWFEETGETIKLALTRSGKEIVIDGQHRLAAAMNVKKPISFYVFRYVPEKAFQHLDQGSPRTLKDIFDIHNKGWSFDARVLSSTATMLWKRDITGDPSRKPDSDEMESQGNIAAHSWKHYGSLPVLLKEIADDLAKIQRGGIGAKSLHLYLQHEWSGYDEELADEVREFLAARGEWFYEQKKLNRAAERGKDSPKARKKMQELSDSPEYNAPSKVWELAIEAVLEKRKDLENRSGQGRIMMGGGKDMTDFTMKAFMIAWNCERTATAVSAKKRFDKLIEDRDGVGEAE